MDVADETGPTNEPEKRLPLSKKIEPRLEWDDLVFAQDVRAQLAEIVGRWRNRTAVHS